MNTKPVAHYQEPDVRPRLHWNLYHSPSMKFMEAEGISVWSFNQPTYRHHRSFSFHMPLRPTKLSLSSSPALCMFGTRMSVVCEIHSSKVDSLSFSHHLLTCHARLSSAVERVDSRFLPLIARNSQLPPRCAILSVEIRTLNSLLLLSSSHNTFVIYRNHCYLSIDPKLGEEPRGRFCDFCRAHRRTCYWLTPQDDSCGLCVVNGQKCTSTKRCVIRLFLTPGVNLTNNSVLLKERRTHTKEE